MSYLFNYVFELKHVNNYFLNLWFFLFQVIKYYHVIDFLKFILFENMKKIIMNINDLYGLHDFAIWVYSVYI